MGFVVGSSVSLIKSVTLSINANIVHSLNLRAREIGPPCLPDAQAMPVSHAQDLNITTARSPFSPLPSYKSEELRCYVLACAKRVFCSN